MNEPENMSQPADKNKIAKMFAYRLMVSHFINVPKSQPSLQPFIGELSSFSSCLPKILSSKYRKQRLASANIAPNISALQAPRLLYFAKSPFET